MSIKSSFLGIDSINKTAYFCFKYTKSNMNDLLELKEQFEIKDVPLKGYFLPSILEEAKDLEVGYS